MAKVDRLLALQLIAEGKSNTEISKVFGCDPSAISHIRRGFVVGRDHYESAKLRFFERRVIVGECWEISGAESGKGYVAFGFKGKQGLAHRVAYEIFIGPIPEGLFVLHRCDNRKCANPKHLFLGTHDDNMQDMDSKGRRRSGEKHYMARLTDDLVRTLRAEYKPGDSWMALEKKYGINRGVLRPAILGITWKHVK